MRITDVQVTIIEQELSAPFWTSHSPITHVREVVAWIHTDDGLVGVGEAKTATPARTARVILNGFKPFLTGSDPLETERLWERMFSLTWDGTSRARGWSRDEVLNAIAAVDIALWDLKGKAAEMPVYQLLGGENRPQPFYSTLGYFFDDMSINEQADRLASFVDRLGLAAVKVKIGRSVEEDIERVDAFRHALGDEIELMADANLGYTVDDAIQAGRHFEDNGLFWYEEPVRWYDRYKGLGKVAAAVSIPLHAGESEHTRFECRDLIVDGRVKYMSFDATVAGGVTEWLRVAYMSEIDNALMAPHCEPQIHGHLMAAVPNPSLLEVHPDEERHPLWDHGYIDRAEVKGNTLILPDKPGFGVEFDPDYLDRFGTKFE